MADGFNGATIKWNTTDDQTPLLSISYDKTAAEIDVTGAADSNHTYITGIPDETITCEVVGQPTTVDVGTTAALVTITWGDETTETFTTGECTSISKSGSIDDKHTSTITFKRAS